MNAVPLHRALGIESGRFPDARRAVLAAMVDRALGEHATRAAITVEEYAHDIARCGRSSAYEAVRTGQVPSFKVAGRIRIPVPALAAQLLGVEMTNGHPAQVAVVADSEDHGSRVCDSA